MSILHVYLATIKKTYFCNAKYIEANAQALNALKYSLSKEYLSMISLCDSAFTVWNILTSPELQTTKNVEKESSREEFNQACFMVQGNDSLEINSDTQLDDSSSSSCDDNMDADALNEELSIVCENLLEKYKVLKKSLKLKEENKDLFSKLHMTLQERVEISSERIH